MAVSSHYQGLGIGQKLLQVAIQFARDENYKDIVLSTTYNQQQAKRFYEKNGFVVESTYLVRRFGIPLFCIYSLRYIN